MVAKLGLFVLDITPTLGKSRSRKELLEGEPKLEEEPKLVGDDVEGEDVEEPKFKLEEEEEEGSRR